LTNPWVIGIVGGIAASIIAGLILYYFFGIGKPKHKSEMPINSITPHEISNNIEKAPPFQKDQVAKTYHGIRVQWEVEFSSISDFGIRHHIYTHSSDTEIFGCLIKFPVHLKLYPQFKFMKKGEKFTVQGTISSIDDLGIIHLQKCKLFFFSMTDEPNQKSGQLIQKGQENVSLVATPVISQPTAIPSSAASSKNSITPNEIEKALEDLPPFQIQQGTNNFVGLEVDWLVELRSTFTIENQLYLITSSPNSYLLDIVFPIDIEQYPQLKIMKEGEQFVVKGKIADVYSNKITLDHCSLQFKK
jgi:hypothetical protein